MKFLTNASYKMLLAIISLPLLFNVTNANSREEVPNDKELLTQLIEMVEGNEILTQYVTELGERFLKLQKQCEHGGYYDETKNYSEYSDELENVDKEDYESDDWIVIQRRQDGSEDFYRNWSEYKEGFGNKTGEFFIGLDKLYELTNTAEGKELLFVLEDFENDRRYAKYDYFAIGDESEKYRLNELGPYSGTAGDSFSYHYGQMFSTKDEENDENRLENCAQQYTGAWWYNACHRSNLNGRYLYGKIGQADFGQGIHWNTFHNLYYSLKFVEIKIRPIVDNKSDEQYHDSSDEGNNEVI